MNKLDELVQEKEDLKLRVNALISLLKEARESVHVAIGLELEYADYPSAERLRSLKLKIEEEIVKNEHAV
jgi:RNase H-fold protein (predicted Holliday junction resolvase)